MLSFFAQLKVKNFAEVAEHFEEAHGTPVFRGTQFEKRWSIASAHNVFVIAGRNTKLVLTCGSHRVKKNSVGLL